MSEAGGAGFEFHVPADPAGVRIVIERGCVEPDARLDAAWERRVRANPRLFDGPMLAVVGVDGPAGRVVCRPDRYRRLAVPEEEGGGALLLAVRGVMTARDAAGREHVLLARRGEQSRMYGGQWEVAPAGGVDPPEDGRAELGVADLTAELARELREETGLEHALAGARLACLCLDRTARSLDVVLRRELEGMPRPPAGHVGHEHAWEVREACWTPVEDVAALERHEGERFSPVTRAIWRWLGWSG